MIISIIISLFIFCFAVLFSLLSISTLHVVFFHFIFTNPIRGGFETFEEETRQKQQQQQQKGKKKWDGLE